LISATADSAGIAAAYLMDTKNEKREERPASARKTRGPDEKFHPPQRRIGFVL
jgi:hypothetical protein